MKGELYEYNGQMLTQFEIARLTGINRSTLADWYNRTGNMNEAVRQMRENNKTRYIEYNGEISSLTAIAKKEDLKIESLQKFYEQANHDIYEAVRLTKEAKLKRNGSILYNGRMMSILAIANENGLEHHSLGNYYKQTNDIYKAVELTKEAKDRHRGIIEYKGKIMSISGIAELEGIKALTLKKFYESYKDIEKAVFITKESQLRRKQALLRGKKASYEELANEFGISVIELDRKIKSGVKLDKEFATPRSKDILKYDEDSLYRYCLDHSYNYWVIRHLIQVYGKEPKEAIKEYVANGQKIPTKWIYEKYNVLFKHLTLKFGLDSNRIIRTMKEYNCGIDAAITRLVIVSNNADTDFKKAEIDWMEELYSFVEKLSKDEYAQVKYTFFITEREEKFIKDKKTIIDSIRRQLLLYELSLVIDEWPVSELTEMMELYNISDEERRTIVLDLYAPFEEKVINPTEEHQRKNEKLSDLVLDNSISLKEIINSSELSDLEKNEVIRKKEALQKICGSVMNELDGQIR